MTEAFLLCESVYSHLIHRGSSMKNVQQSRLPWKEIKTQVLQIVCEKRTFSGHLFGETGPLVVMVHGFPDDYLTFAEQVPALVEAGYRVLLPVLPGYEESSVDPDGRYFLPELVWWLVSWLDELKEDKVHLVGHDWGAVIAWLAAARYPERFHTLTAIAIPSLRHMAQAIRHHPTQLLKSWYMGFFQLPGVAEAAVGAGNGWLIRRLWRNWSPGWNGAPEHVDRICRLLQQPAIRQAALGYYRSLFRVMDATHREGRSWLRQSVAVPTLMITGARDGCMDTRLFDTALVDADFPAGVELYRLMGAGHFCHLEKPALVNRKLLQFLNDSVASPARPQRELSRHLG